MTAPISTMPSLPRWKAMRDQAQAIIEDMLEEMEAYRDERSEQWQESDRGTAFRERINQADAARTAIEEVAFEQPECTPLLPHIWYH